MVLVIAVSVNLCESPRIHGIQQQPQGTKIAKVTATEIKHETGVWSANYLQIVPHPKFKNLNRDNSPSGL